MQSLSEQIVSFLKNQGFVIVSTISRDGGIHSSCKGITKIDRNGKIYLFDLYMGRTYENLKENPAITLTSADEHRFIGYCLKGKAEIVASDKFNAQMITAWDDMIVSRVTRRLLRNIRNEKGHHSHPEVRLPRPKYMIVMEVEEIIDLTPQHLK